MRWPLLVVLAAATGGPAAAQPSRGGPPRPRPPRAIAIDVTRAIGGFDKSILKRELRRHATSCRQRGAHGVAQLSLMLRDAPGRRGMRVLEAKGDPQPATLPAPALAGRPVADRQPRRHHRVPGHGPRPALTPQAETPAGQREAAGRRAGDVTAASNRHVAAGMRERPPRTCPCRCPTRAGACARRIARGCRATSRKPGSAGRPPIRSRSARSAPVPGCASPAWCEPRPPRVERPSQGQRALTALIRSTSAGYGSSASSTMPQLLFSPSKRPSAG